jgi:hypothetical protein
MAVRFHIRDLLVATVITAVLLGLLAPRVRSWDRQTRDLFLVVGMISGLFLACMSPVWVVLFLRRRRCRLGLEIRPIDRGALFMAFISGLILFCIAFRLLLVEART